MQHEAKRMIITANIVALLLSSNISIDTKNINLWFQDKTETQLTLNTDIIKFKNPILRIRVINPSWNKRY